MIEGTQQISADMIVPTEEPEEEVIFAPVASPTDAEDVDTGRLRRLSADELAASEALSEPRGNRESRARDALQAFDFEATLQDKVESAVRIEPAGELVPEAAPPPVRPQRVTGPARPIAPEVLGRDAVPRPLHESPDVTMAVARPLTPKSRVLPVAVISFVVALIVITVGVVYWMHRASLEADRQELERKLAQQQLPDAGPPGLAVAVPASRPAPKVQPAEEPEATGQTADEEAASSQPGSGQDPGLARAELKNVAALKAALKAAPGQKASPEEPVQPKAAAKTVKAEPAEPKAAVKTVKAEPVQPKAAVKTVKAEPGEPKAAVKAIKAEPGEPKAAVKAVKGEPRDIKGAAKGEPASEGDKKCPPAMRYLGTAEEGFCIDRYEYPGKGRLPSHGLAIGAARAACKTRGQRLCSAKEWLRACGSLFPYGKTYDAAACNTGSGSAQPSGARKACRSRFGVFDLSGNVSEWVEEGVAMGGDARSEQGHASCPARSGGGPLTGFRCCSDPEWD